MIFNLEIVLVQPICLPPPGLEFHGKEAVAMGWGGYKNHAFGAPYWVSKFLKYVRLKVSNRKFKNKRFFGTEINATRLNPILTQQCNTKNQKLLKKHSSKTLKELGKCNERIKDICDKTLKCIFIECENLVKDVCGGDSGMCMHNLTTVIETYAKTIYFMDLCFFRWSFR